MRPVTIPGLDVLRFYACMLVIWQHSFSRSFNIFYAERGNGDIFKKFMATGEMGVQLFFCLSGFIITYLLITEHLKTGKISLWYFYIRRTLRIWPLYYTLMIVGLFILPTFIPVLNPCGEYVTQLTFLNNFRYIDPLPCRQITAIAWSVAVEEQFYIFWPLFLIFLLKVKKLFYPICILLFIGSLVFLFTYHYKPYQQTISNICYLVAGCTLAWYKCYGISYPYLVRAVKKYHYSLFILIVILWFIKNLSQELNIISNTILPLAYALIILFFAELYVVKNILVRYFQKLGIYTYSIYLLNPLCYTIVYIISRNMLGKSASLPFNNFIESTIALLFTFLAAYISFNVIEKPFLKIKNKFSIINTRS